MRAGREGEQEKPQPGRRGGAGGARGGGAGGRRRGATRFLRTAPASRELAEGTGSPLGPDPVPVAVGVALGGAGATQAPLCWPGPGPCGLPPSPQPRKTRPAEGVDEPLWAPGQRWSLHPAGRRGSEPPRGSPNVEDGRGPFPPAAQCPLPSRGSPGCWEGPGRMAPDRPSPGHARVPGGGTHWSNITAVSQWK